MNESGANLTLRQLVKVKLDEHGLTNKWLVKRLLRRDMKVSGSTVSAALTGQRVGIASDLIIIRALEELQKYEERMMSD